MSGYSPNILVFGRNPNLPSVLSSSLPALEPCSVSESVQRNLTAMHSARKAFIAAESSERIRRALRMKVIMIPLLVMVIVCIISGIIIKAGKVQVKL